MDASGSSQLSQYLESLSLAPAIKSVHSAPGTSVFGKIKCLSCSTLTDFLRALSREIVLGVSKDIVYLMELTSDSLTELSTSCFSVASRNATLSQAKTVYAGRKFNHLRRFFLIALVVSCSRYSFNVNTTYSIDAFFGTMGSAIFWLALVLLASALIIGTILNSLIKSMMGKMKQTESTACYLLGWIKRLQLTGLGRQITHPMPPIAKIEESVRETSGSMMLSCPETRQAVHFALTSFSRDLRSATEALRHTSEPLKECISNIDVLETKDVPSISHLQSLLTEIFRTQTLHCYREILLSLETPFPFDNREKSSTSNILELLMLPLYLADITSSIDKFQRRLLLICREAATDIEEDSFQYVDQPTSDARMESCAVIKEAGKYSNGCVTSVTHTSVHDPVLSQSVSNSIGDTQGSLTASEIKLGKSDWGNRTNQKQAQSIASCYTDIRLQLLHQRHAAECTLNTLWLCEQELSKKEVTRLLLHQPAQSDRVKRDDVKNSKSTTTIRPHVSCCSDIAPQMSSQDTGCLPDGYRLSEGLNENEKGEGGSAGEGVVGRLHRVVTILSRSSAEQGTLDGSGRDPDTAQPLCDRLLHLISLIESASSSDSRSPHPTCSTALTPDHSGYLNNDTSRLPMMRGSKSEDATMPPCGDGDKALAEYESVNHDISNADFNNLLNDDIESKIAKVYIATIPALTIASTPLLRSDDRLGGARHSAINTQTLLSELHSHIHTMSMNREVVEKVIDLDLHDVDSTCDIAQSSSTCENIRPSGGIDNLRCVTIEEVPLNGVTVLSCQAPGEECDDQAMGTQEKKHRHTAAVPQPHYDYSAISLSNELSAVLRGVKKMEGIQFSIDSDDDDDDDDDDKNILKELDYIEVEVAGDT